MGALSWGSPSRWGCPLSLPASPRGGEGARWGEQWEGEAVTAGPGLESPGVCGARSVITSKDAAIHPGPRAKTGWGVIFEMGPRGPFHPGKVLGAMQLPQDVKQKHRSKRRGPPRKGQKNKPFIHLIKCPQTAFSTGPPAFGTVLLAGHVDASWRGTWPAVTRAVRLPQLPPSPPSLPRVSSDVKPLPVSPPSPGREAGLHGAPTAAEKAGLPDLPLVSGQRLPGAVPTGTQAQVLRKGKA